MNIYDRPTPGSGLKLGEYLFYNDKQGVLRCLRHGLEWREFLGDHAVVALFEHARRLEQERDALMEALQELSQMAADDASLFKENSAWRPFFLIHAGKINDLLRAIKELK